MIYLAIIGGILAAAGIATPFFLRALRAKERELQQALDAIDCGIETDVYRDA